MRRRLCGGGGIAEERCACGARAVRVRCACGACVAAEGAGEDHTARRRRTSAPSGTEVRVRRARVGACGARAEVRARRCACVAAESSRHTTPIHQLIFITWLGLGLGLGLRSGLGLRLGLGSGLSHVEVLVSVRVCTNR